MTTKRTRINYLNNADLLREIHISKMSYCYIENSNCYDYDIITDDIRNITHNFLQQGLENRIKRLTTEQLRIIQKQHNCTPKTALEYVDQELLESFKNHTHHDVIVRVMTNEHITTEKDKDDEDQTIRTNFKPFKHYQLKQHGQVEEVVRSHWKGSIERGEFCMTHGKLTESLGLMFITLCDKIGMRSNYRGYSFLDEMKADARYQLTKNALLFDESRITVQLNPFAYYTTIVNHAFKAVLNSEKKGRNLRDDLLEECGFDPSTTRIIEYEMAMAQRYQDKRTAIFTELAIDSSSELFDWLGTDIVVTDDDIEDLPDHPDYVPEDDE